MEDQTKNVMNESALGPETVHELELLVKSKLGELNKTSRILKDEVFNILSDHSNLIQYPIEDDEFCALVCFKKNRIFSVINSNIPYDKQIFAAAHELYHIWYDQDVLKHGEILNRKVLDIQLEPGIVELRELKANRFAAMLLVPTDVLRQELDYLKIAKSSLELSTIVRLIDTFGIPYKTMVRRLFEIEFISDDQCKQYLEIPDRDEKTGVLLLQRKMRLGFHLQERTREYRFGHMVENAILAYEQQKISFEKLKDLLNYARVKPDEVISLPDEHAFLSEEELIALMEEDIDQ